MNFKTLPLFLLSLAMLSGCTNSCKGDQNQASNAEQPAATSSDSAQVVPTEQDANNSEQAAADESAATETDTVAAAEQQN